MYIFHLALAKASAHAGQVTRFPQINIANEEWYVNYHGQDDFRFHYKRKTAGSLKIDSWSIIWRTVPIASVAI
jgi:hypothetical protein